MIMKIICIMHFPENVTHTQATGKQGYSSCGNNDWHIKGLVGKSSSFV